MRRLVRYAWHITSIAWVGMGLALVVLARTPLEPSGRHVAGVIGVTFLVMGGDDADRRAGKTSGVAGVSGDCGILLRAACVTPFVPAFSPCGRRCHRVSDDG
jgi:hypothetical protein